MINVIDRLLCAVHQRDLSMLSLLTQAGTGDEPLQVYAQFAGIASATLAVLTALFTRTFPWAWAKYLSRSVAKRQGAELYPVAAIERSIRYYVRPDCQDIDPAGGEEPRNVFAVRQNLFKVLDEALAHPTEYKYLILLADSGMGKTSALLNYYVRHLRRLRKRFNIALVPLGIPDADQHIERIQDKRNTVLFLDALDEDTLAIVDHAERLRILINHTRDFYRVMISCRTQFFSRDEEIPSRTGVLKITSRAAGEPAEYLFHKIYLAPFSEAQIQKFLSRLYPFWQRRRRRQARRMARKVSSLSARPMLLAHIDDLVQSGREITTSCGLYERMIDAWLVREGGFIENKDDLRQFSEDLAVDLYLHRSTRGTERITHAQLAVLGRQWRVPLDDWKLSGRSLLNRDADGNYKFAHRSIMEYLFVVRFCAGDTQTCAVGWTDQMRDFLREMILDFTLMSRISEDVDWPSSSPAILGGKTEPCEDGLLCVLKLTEWILGTLPNFRQVIAVEVVHLVKSSSYQFFSADAVTERMETAISSTMFEQLKDIPASDISRLTVIPRLGTGMGSAALLRSERLSVHLVGEGYCAWFLVALSHTSAHRPISWNEAHALKTLFGKVLPESRISQRFRNVHSVTETVD